MDILLELQVSFAIGHEHQGWIVPQVTRPGFSKLCPCCALINAIWFGNPMTLPWAILQCAKKATALHQC